MHYGENDSQPPTTARFLGSHNPAQVKRIVLASFTDVLLPPVTIVPRTVRVVGAVLTTGGNADVQGISMLNPQQWASQRDGNGNEAYSKNLAKDEEADATVFEIGHEDEEREYIQWHGREAWYDYNFLNACDLNLMSHQHLHPHPASLLLLRRPPERLRRLYLLWNPRKHE